MGDESKEPGVREAWKTLTAELGKETWGGISVGEGEKVGLGLIAWDSLEVSQNLRKREPGKFTNGTGQ